MPPPRNHPARGSQRRNTLQDEPPMRTRSGRGNKPSTSSKDKVEGAAPRSTSSQANVPSTRKATRSSSNYSAYAVDAGPDVYATYEEPYLMVFGLSRDFFDTLKESPKSARRARQIKSDPSTLPPLFTQSSEDEEESTEESDVPTSSHPTPRGRGRGGRGSRGGRGRGRGRARGRGGRGSLARDVSPVRTRPTRNAAPMFPLAEDDDEDSSNQTSPVEDAKDSPDPKEEVPTADVSSEDDDDDDEDDEDDDDDDDQGERMHGVQHNSNTPPESLHEDISMTYGNESTAAQRAPPKISVPQDSASQTPNEALTPAESTAPKLMDPEDDILSDSDLPGPWIEDQPLPKEAECEDRADYLLKTRFKPMSDVQDIIAALTKFPMSQRSTENLYALAENTQYILKAWQDEYLMLDARTAPHAHPPKKPAQGGRIPMVHQIFEDMKEADLYGYTFDPKKAPGCQDPFTQRPGHEKSGGRELRQRRTRDMLDSAAPSEEEEEEEAEGRTTKRQRRATRRFDGSEHGTDTPPKRKGNGWGGARKKGVSKYAQPTQEASATPEPEARGVKRARGGPSGLLHQRIQEMREESAVTSSGDEGSSNANSMDLDESQQDMYRKRGRPAGSKNVGRRSDYGIKKGPRKKTDGISTPNSHGTNIPPPLLQSMSDGQSQFSIDPQPTNGTPPVLAPGSSETVFQATPQPAGAQDTSFSAPTKAPTPDSYMNTTPLSQYSNPNVEDSAGTQASGSRRKPRVKSEKRSQSMTIWWAERKARQKELEEKNGTPVKPPPSRSNSSTGKKGGRASAASVVTTPTETPEAQSFSQEAAPRNSIEGSEPFLQPPSQPPSQPSSQPSSQHVLQPGDMYVSAPSPFAYAAPPPLVIQQLQSSPLAAIPSLLAGSPQNSNAMPRALAPAPLPPQQPPTYPSPYGPRQAPRPKSSGPPALAPAPPHVSPYPPMATGPVAQREMPFKVMIPGPPPAEDRRLSR
ncbi:hypothetical protein BS50DRAFT_575100 [Corynespora cassiicola Philippines]|uniref:Uncharacterized protein n=1 Tax=Corynespora cassiicola Philippines TaxID=1448308 RepID=A0A2T2NHS2_CORCC|nr:hypothetical protein BS50DRAFT_575100 [Corynespora cassiicola Philippines]